MRTIYNINQGWQFYKSADLKTVLGGARGEAVDLPHTWNAADGQDGGNDYYRGTCLYTRSLKAPALQSGEEVWLEINGAAHTAVVSLNGETLAEHKGGYSTFRVNLTGRLKDENLLAIAVDNSENDTVYPQKADFTFYGGLYRDVNLITVPAAHFALGYWGAPGIRVTPRVDPDTRTAQVTAEAWVEGGGRTVTFTVAGQSQTVPVADNRAAAQFTLENVRLWDGLNDPFLYTATAALDSGDAVQTRFGCRKFEIDPQKGFLLNGRSYPLRGVARHQDVKGRGNALTL